MLAVFGIVLISIAGGSREVEAAENLDSVAAGIGSEGNFPRIFRSSRSTAEFNELRETLLSTDADLDFEGYWNSLRPLRDAIELDDEDPQKEEILDVIFEALDAGKLRMQEAYRLIVPRNYHRGVGGFLNVELSQDAADYLSDLDSLPMNDLSAARLSLACVYRLEACSEVTDKVLKREFGTSDPVEGSYSGDYYSLPSLVRNAAEFKAASEGGRAMDFYLTLLDRAPNDSSQKFYGLNGLDSPEVIAYLIRYIFSEELVLLIEDRYESSYEMVGVRAIYALNEIIKDDYPGFPAFGGRSDEERVGNAREWLENNFDVDAILERATH